MPEFITLTRSQAGTLHVRPEMIAAYSADPKYPGAAIYLAGQQFVVDVNETPAQIAALLADALAGGSRPRTLADIRASGLLDGYSEQRPDAGDQRIGREATCSACGHRGLRCRIFAGPGSREGFMLCPACGLAEEF